MFVDESADLSLLAQGIVFAKLLNAGQICICADYVSVIFYLSVFSGGIGKIEKQTSISERRNWPRLVADR